MFFQEEMFLGFAGLVGFVSFMHSEYPLGVFAEFKHYGYLKNIKWSNISFRFIRE